MAMTHFVGLDVSVKETAVCVVDDAGKLVCEQKVPTEPDDIVTLLTSIDKDYGRIGIEAGPLSQWLVNGLTAAGLPVVCVETRHMMALLKAQQINKSDRNDARGIAQMMRVGLFKPVHVKTQLAQEQRMLLSSRIPRNQPDEKPPIQELYAKLTQDLARNDLIFDDILSALEAGQSPVVITERKDHLEMLAGPVCPSSRRTWSFFEVG